MSAPRRVQLRRTRGWRAPPNTVKVDRSTRFGNPFVDRKACGCGASIVEDCRRGLTHADDAAAAFAAMLPRHSAQAALIREQLRGKNLACWCPLDQPCHADVLLEIANRERL